MIEEKYKKEIISLMKEKFGYRNNLSIPKIRKVVVNVGVGSVLRDEQVQQLVARDLATITGQKAVATIAKRAISAFKVREGMVVGYKVTLRGKMMFDFIDRLINVVLPRTRDFRGLESKSVDKSGNLTIGIKEHIIFPEISQEEIKKIFGLEVTINTDAKSKEEALELFRLLGFPIKKDK
ncbi:MAG: 50S ribosomal protein L5 [bacterium]|nr:50S ribosomal protein L5 [bacterium]